MPKSTKSHGNRRLKLTDAGLRKHGKEKYDKDGKEKCNKYGKQKKNEMWAPLGIFGLPKQSNTRSGKVRQNSTYGSGGSISTGSRSSSSSKSYTVEILLTYRDGTTAVRHQSAFGSSAQEAAERALQLYPISGTNTPKAIIARTVQNVRPN